MLDLFIVNQIGRFLRNFGMLRLLKSSACKLWNDSKNSSLQDSSYDFRGLFLASFLSVVVVSFIELMSLRGKFSAKDNRSIFSQIFSPSDSLGMLIGPVNSRRLMSFDGIRLFTYIFVFIFHAVLVQLTAGIGVLVGQWAKSFRFFSLKNLISPFFMLENPNSLNDLPGKWFFQPFASRFYFSALPFFG